MGRYTTKLQSIMEANELLEKRILNEQTTPQTSLNKHDNVVVNNTETPKIVDTINNTISNKII